MTILTEKKNDTLVVAIEGRLDTVTAPELDAEIIAKTEGVTELVIDMAKIEYISSAGLRVLLSAHKRMMKVGSMQLVNVGDMVMEVFEMTGFADILNIQ